MAGPSPFPVATAQDFIRWDAEAARKASEKVSEGAEREAWRAVIQAIDDLKENGERSRRAFRTALRPFETVRGKAGEAEISVGPGMLRYGPEADQTSVVTVDKTCADTTIADRYHAVVDGDIVYLEVSINATSRKPESAEIKVSGSGGWTDYPDPASFSGDVQTKAYIPLAVIEDHVSTTKKCAKDLLPGGLFIFEIWSGDIILEPRAWDFKWCYMPAYAGSAI